MSEFKSKSKTVGYVAKGKKEGSKYIKFSEDVVLKKGDTLQLFKPRQGEKTSDEKYAEILEWKVSDVVLFNNDQE